MMTMSKECVCSMFIAFRMKYFDSYSGRFNKPTKFYDDSIPYSHFLESVTNAFTKEWTVLKFVPSNCLQIIQRQFYHFVILTVRVGLAGTIFLLLIYFNQRTNHRNHLRYTSAVILIAVDFCCSPMEKRQISFKTNQRVFSAMASSILQRI